MNQKLKEFLEKHGMSAALVVPSAEAGKMRDDMQRGLEGKDASMAMIPTYLSNSGATPLGEKAIVIDAGGTNFRCGLLEFTEGGFELTEVKKSLMPGIGKSATWEEFIRFVVDMIEPLCDRADKIGFCFSYSADITPEIDGRVIRIDKEVVITGSEGQLVGASMVKELEKRGIYGKRVGILNDTVAVLLGGASVLDKSAFSGFAGQVSGTGTNTCCELPAERILKINGEGQRGMIVNLESGLYTGIAQGDFDRQLDAESNNPGSKIFEKLTAGVYLGELCRIMLKAAADEALLSEGCAASVMELGRIDSAVIDAWSCGENLSDICAEGEDADFVRELCCELFERSARCMCTNILAIMLLTGKGVEGGKPFCVCAEGSLVQKSRYYRPALERLLSEEGAKLGLCGVLRVGDGSTMPGSAAAALLNL